MLPWSKIVVETVADKAEVVVEQVVKSGDDWVEEGAGQATKSGGGLGRAGTGKDVDFEIAQNAFLNSSNELLGVEKATPELLEAIAKKRTVVIAKEGTDDLRMLDAFGAEASVGGEEMTHILVRENPSKAALLEAFLHGTQFKLGIIKGTQHKALGRHM